VHLAALANKCCIAADENGGLLPGERPWMTCAEAKMTGNKRGFLLTPTGDAPAKSPSDWVKFVQDRMLGAGWEAEKRGSKDDF
jgi:hypothetical protein